MWPASLKLPQEIDFTPLRISNGGVKIIKHAGIPESILHRLVVCLWEVCLCRARPDIRHSSVRMENITDDVQNFKDPEGCVRSVNKLCACMSLPAGFA